MTHFEIKEIQKNNIITIINVGSYKVRTVICSFSFSKIKVLGYGEKRQSRLDIINNEINNIAGICETIKQAILKAEYQAGYKPKHIIINPFFSNTFFHSKTIHYKQEDNSITIGKRDIFKIIDHIEKISIGSVRYDIETKFGFHKNDICHILSNISQITTDGVDTKDLIGITCEDIKIKLLNCFIPKLNYNILHDISNFLGKEIIKIVPEEYAIAKVGDQDKENIFLNIGNSSTSLSVKGKNNFLIGSIKLDIGIGDLVKSIKKGSDKSRGEIIKKLDRTDLFKSEKEEFLTFFGDVIITGLHELLHGAICPHEFILTGGGSNNIFIKEYISNINFHAFDIKILKPIEFIPPSISEIKKISGVEDILKISNIGLIAQVIASHKILNASHDIIEQALEKSVEKIFRI